MPLVSVPTALMVAGGLGAVGSAASGLMGYFGSQNASKAQADAAANALAFQKQVYAQNQSNLSPWIDTGKGANYTLASLYGIGKDGSAGGKPDYSSFTNSPDYGFAFDQGQKATKSLLSAKGDLFSGTGLTELTKWGQGLASQQYQNYYGRLQQLSQMGLQGASSLAGVGIQSGNQIGQSYGALGQANASGYMGGANALTAGIGGAANAASTPFYMQAMNSMRGDPSSYSHDVVNAEPGSMGKTA